MRAMDREPESWIDTPAFNWTPDAAARRTGIDGALPAEPETWNHGLNWR